MLLSVIIPCYNEKNTINAIIDAVRNSPYPHKEIIVIDDCSTDGTREKLKNEISPLVAKIIYHKVNQGKGAALRSGIAAASGDVVIIQDADLEYSPEEFSRLLAPLVDGRADAVFGSRFLTYEARRALYYWHRLGNNFLTTLSNMFTNLDLTDMETCYKVMKTEHAHKLNLQENRFGVEPEITAKLARMRIRVYEVPISYHGRTYAEGKKITWKDGFRAIYCIVKYNLLTRK